MRFRHFLDRENATSNITIESVNSIDSFCNGRHLRKIPEPLHPLLTTSVTYIYGLFRHYSNTKTEGPNISVQSVGRSKDCLDITYQLSGTNPLLSPVVFGIVFGGGGLTWGVPNDGHSRLRYLPTKITASHGDIT